MGFEYCTSPLSMFFIIKIRSAAYREETRTGVAEDNHRAGCDSADRPGPEAPISDRHRNLAWATQALYEDALFHLLNALQRRYGHSAVALAGGCAYNSVANGKIRDRTGFKQCYLQSAAGDAGGAIGAAYAVLSQRPASRPDDPCVLGSVLQ
jgi:predicted NodU family carbamoyl transferase